MDFHSEVLKVFEGNFRKDIKLHIIYFSLTNINIRTVIIVFSIYFLSVHSDTPESSYHELW